MVVSPSPRRCARIVCLDVLRALLLAGNFVDQRTAGEHPHYAVERYWMDLSLHSVISLHAHLLCSTSTRVHVFDLAAVRAGTSSPTALPVDFCFGIFPPRRLSAAGCPVFVACVLYLPLLYMVIFLFAVDLSAPAQLLCMLTARFNK